MSEKIRDLGVPVTGLDMPRGRPTWSGLRQLYLHLKRGQPEVVQTWMYHANLIGGVVAWLAGIDRIFWNIRSSTLELGRDKRTTIYTSQLCAWLSAWLPDRIITCAREAGRVHADIGYDASKMIVVPNGFDTDQYRPDEQRRTRVREELTLDSIPVVGLVARYHPQKDHRTFLRAAAQLAERFGEIQFVLCGSDVTWENRELVSWIDEHGLRDYMKLLGEREDIASVMNSFDVSVLSSATGEAFPNVVGEAMACGIPCVVTRVGDSAEIVGETGFAVPIEAPEELAIACERILTLPESERRELGRKARKRILQHYSLSAIADRYLQIYREGMESTEVS